VRVCFLGSGDAFGNGGRLQACLLLEAAGVRLLVDCGATSLVALKRHGIDPATIGWVLLTHLHGDHFGGLPFLVLDGQFGRRTRPLLVAGPAGTAARLEAATEVLFPGSSRTARRFATEVVELEPRAPRRVGPAVVTAYPVDHPSGAPALALRLEVEGRVLACSGDTAWTESLVEAARGADLFVCEAYTFDRRVPYHLDHATLRGQLDRLGCRRVVLTHLGPDMLAHRDEAVVACAEDGLALEL
jgi:ribonuclease BN (tRNA processing enzyme)